MPLLSTLVTRRRLEELRLEKAASRGGFRQRIWLEETYPA